MMYIKLLLKSGKFQIFRIDDIISIDPTWLTEDLLDYYELRLAGQQGIVELTEAQAEQLVNMLQYQVIRA
jgi:hypothetical protein